LVIVGSSVVYWGDIDSHGLAILSGVRATVPHVRSVLMDLDTLRVHADRTELTAR
jgi:hypothetical protein